MFRRWSCGRRGRWTCSGMRRHLIAARFDDWQAVSIYIFFRVSPAKHYPVVQCTPLEQSRLPQNTTRNAVDTDINFTTTLSYRTPRAPPIHHRSSLRPCQLLVRRFPRLPDESPPPDSSIGSVHRPLQVHAWLPLSFGGLLCPPIIAGFAAQVIDLLLPTQDSLV